MNTHRLNGRHITAIVTALCITVVLAPVSVLATTSASRVIVTDPTHSTHGAHVSAGGALSVTAAPGVPVTPFTKSVSNPPTFTVPARKHLVTETVSVNIEVTSGNSVYAELDFETGGVGSALYLPLTYSYTQSGTDIYVATLPVRLYSDPGSSVSLSIFSPSGTIGTSFLSVSGYLQ